MMTNNNYLEQLTDSAASIKLSVPNYIFEEIIEKITLVQSRSNNHLPKKIFCVKKIVQEKYSEVTHLANMRQSDWQFEILSATVNLTKKEILIALLKKEGTIEIKKTVVEKRNGNNSLRTQFKH